MDQAHFLISRLSAAALVAVLGCGLHPSTGQQHGGAGADGETGTASEGAGGAPSSAGSGGAGQGGQAGAASTIPGESQRETAVLAPLFTDDGSIDRATGAELVELTRAIGAARGYLVCRCLFSPTEPPADVESMAKGCGRDDSAARVVATDDRARCITERMAEVPGFDDHLRCIARRARALGQAEASVCWQPGTEPTYPEIDCAPPAGADQLEMECNETTFCADGSPVRGYACDMIAACPDLSDERNCYDSHGRDLVLCGDEIWSPLGFCWEEVDCGVGADPPMCDPARPERFLCSDGSDVRAGVVCDRVNDCPDGRDEDVCLR